MWALVDPPKIVTHRFFGSGINGNSFAGAISRVIEDPHRFFGSGINGNCKTSFRSSPFGGREILTASSEAELMETLIDIRPSHAKSFRLTASSEAELMETQRLPVAKDLLR